MSLQPILTKRLYDIIVKANLVFWFIDSGFVRIIEEKRLNTTKKGTDQATNNSKLICYLIYLILLLSRDRRPYFRSVYVIKLTDSLTFISLQDDK